MAIDLRLLPFPPRAFAPDYRAVNPLMTVPGWVEDGRLMTRSAAICERIAEGTPLEVRREEGITGRGATGCTAATRR